MKNVYEVLRQKELELARLEKEVEALRVVAPLLSPEDAKRWGQDTPKPTLASSQATQTIRIPQQTAVNQNPQPARTPAGKKRRSAGPSVISVFESSVFSRPSLLGLVVVGW